jgi:DegV family protein with EDD domain
MAEEAKRLGYYFVPLSLTFDGVDYKEGVDITSQRFFELLVNNPDKLPKTSQAAPNDFLPCFLDAKAKGDDVLAITLSSKLSGTFQSANIAAQMAEYPGHIKIVDSLSITPTLRALLKEADANKDKMSLDDLAAYLDGLAHRSQIYGSMNSLEYLYKGGRLSRASYLFGSLAHVNAVCAVKDGSIIVAGRSIGTKSAMKFMTEKLREDGVDPSFVVYPFFSSDEAICDKFVNDFLKPALPGASFADPLLIDPIIGAYTGPALYGIGYIKKPVAK